MTYAAIALVIQTNRKNRFSVEQLSSCRRSRTLLRHRSEPITPGGLLREGDRLYHLNECEVWTPDATKTEGLNPAMEPEKKKKKKKKGKGRWR